MCSSDLITASIVHAKMLGCQGIITAEESSLIVNTLKEILTDIENGNIEFSIENEDIHMNIETILTQRIGDTGKKLHTARSRNDQIAVDMRLYMKEDISEIEACLEKLLAALADMADQHQNTIIPGYTHLQRAQPITLAYHMLAYYQMFKRDKSRFNDCLARMDCCPQIGRAHV